MLDDDESPIATEDDEPTMYDEHIGAAPSIKLVVRGIKRHPARRAFDIVLAGTIVVMFVVGALLIVLF